MPYQVLNAKVTPKYSSVKARYSGFREKRNGPVVTTAVAGSKGLMFVPAACIVLLPQIAIAMANTISARPDQRALAWPKIGIGQNQRSARTTTNAKP